MIARRQCDPRQTKTTGLKLSKQATPLCFLNSMAFGNDFTWIFLAVHILLMLALPLCQSEVWPQQPAVDYTPYKAAQSVLSHSDQPWSLTTESWRGYDLQTSGHLAHSPPTLQIAWQQEIPSGPCKYLSLTHNMVVNCSGMNLATLDPRWFPANTTILLLDHNLLPMVPNFTFSHLAQLSVLCLSNNQISKIQPNTFEGLAGLENLDLENNRLRFDEFSYPPGIFRALKNLKTLRLKRNVPSKAYPKHLFYGLTSLEFLTLDTVGDELQFGDEFSSLTNLSSLELTGEIQTITNISFVNLRHLKYLYIHDSILVKNFSHSALGPLKRLEVFKLYRVHIGVSEALSILKPLALRTPKIKMKCIYFRKIYLSPQELITDLDMGNTVLDPFKTQYLRNICVEHFALIDCHIMVLRADAAISDVWKSCIKVLEVSDNPLFGTLVAFGQVVSSLPSLDTIIATGFNKIPGSNFNDGAESLLSLEEFSSQGFLAHRNHHTLPSYQTLTAGLVSNKRAKSPLSPHDTDGLEPGEAYKECTGISFRMSDSVRMLDLSGLIRGSKLMINICLYAQNLKVLNISFCGLRVFTGVFRGLESLQTIDVSGNDLSVLSVNFMDSLTGLMDLRMANCRLGPSLMFLHGARLFSKLHALQRLDLTANSLSLLDHRIFSTNANLSNLTLSGNKFKEIPFPLTDTPRLQVLDLRANIITTLNPDITEQLDNLAKQNGKFMLLLGENVLSCACDNLLFLQWLQNTNITLDNGGNYTCIDDQGKLSHTAAYSDIQSVWRKCVGEIALSIAIILLFIIFIGFLVFFVIWKNSTFIISTLMHQFIPLKKREDYAVGVFIGYADKDYRFPCQELRKYIEDTLQLSTYLHHRDMPAAADIATSIVDAINSSWRILIVVTESFLREDEWSTFTWKTAIHAQDTENPSRIVVLVEEKLLSRLPRDIVSAVQQDNIVVMANTLHRNYETMDYETREALRTRLVTD